MRQPISIVTLLVLTLTTAAAQHPSMPAGMSHEEHLKQIERDDALKKRGAAAMGFDQDQTTHHFLLTKSGGAIVVASNNSQDAVAIAQVRRHLQEIAGQFAQGEFDKPFATHGELPAGASVMAAKRKLISYRYEERSGGGSVVITTADAAARDAIHEFLRYQIVEHKTGDPLIVTP